MTPAELERTRFEAETRFPELADLDPAVLHQLIAAAAEEVERHAGVRQASEVFLHRAGRPTLITLIRPADAVTGITERWWLHDDAVVLDQADWRQVSEWFLLRLPTGPNRAHTWGEEVVVSYDAAVDDALRRKVVAELVALDAAFQVRERTTTAIGDYSETFADPEPGARRDAILRQLVAEGHAVVL